MSDKRKDPLEILRLLFTDQPDLLRILTLRHLESEGLLGAYREQGGLFASPAVVCVTGRTSAGKTTIGNLLFGEDVMPSTGRLNCTDYIGSLLLRSNLCYIDTPGAGSRENYENVTRLALGLPLLGRLEVPTMKVRDYRPDEPDTYDEFEIPASEWPTRSAAYQPDAIVYVIAPHAGFGRDDAHFLQDMLTAHGAKLVICLNRFRRSGVDLLTPENLLDARDEVEEVYRRVFPGGEIQPRFVELDALGGLGIGDLTREICRTIPSAKLGKVQAVLDGELKEFAARERDRRHRRVLHRIAARLALYTVDQHLGDADVLAEAATAVAQHTAVTFDGMDALAKVDIEIGNLVEAGVGKARDLRTEAVTTDRVETRERPIYHRTPRIETFESTSYIKDVRHRVVKEKQQKGFFGFVGAYFEAGVDHVAEALGGNLDPESHARINARARERTYDTVERTVAEEYQTPVQRIEQRVTGYDEEIVATVTEVVSVVPEVVGKRSLAGGVPVIELLVGVGHGVRRHLAGDGSGVEACIAAAQQQAELALHPERTRLDKLAHEGGQAEAAIVGVLDDRLAGM
ncbi:hypothetical protein FHR83_003799 [Actinoplanes campanulatus]|uniref:50S ribosome-binding GTPase n=1 Tax=Actinoplanes campanulatus TaxID=113559 RepID=A0A7W5FF48_9ACTN|nr:hypothetical protein [Actinoplanes campanulatus]MBB3096129.1 hypothetical protein [Actinoplanes campanulatus]GGN13934.1 hypothetical protein GCM10010109_25130 [Actinoplanes campanulatus]GID36777.1 hypothetical protein Aca09nite_32830 [Actinoplanes campanulatus]